METNIFHHYRYHFLFPTKKYLLAPIFQAYWVTKISVRHQIRPIGDERWIMSPNVNLWETKWFSSLNSLTKYPYCCSVQMWFIIVNLYYYSFLLPFSIEFLKHPNKKDEENLLPFPLKFLKHPNKEKKNYHSPLISFLPYPLLSPPSKLPNIFFHARNKSF